MDLFRESVWKGIISQTRSEGTYFEKAFARALFQNQIFEKVCTTDYINALK